MARINGGGSIAISRWLIALWRYSWFILGQNIYVNTSDRPKRIVSWKNRCTVTSKPNRKCGIFSTPIPQECSAAPYIANFLKK